MSVHKNIMFWRQKRGVSRKELGKAVGVSGAQIRNHEQGITPVKTDRLVLISEHLKIAVATLLRSNDDEEGE